MAKTRITKRKPTSVKAQSGLATSSKATKLRKLAAELRKFALSFPGVTEDYPWGERVVKTGGKKVFVFLGDPYQIDGQLSCTVKLIKAHASALKLKIAKPCGYGLGKHGWVSIRTEPGKPVPTAPAFKKWIKESYESVTG